MDYPVKMYHRDTEAHVRSGHSEYPIIVHSEEDHAALEPGWCADPVEAAEWVASHVVGEQRDGAATTDAVTDEDMSSTSGDSSLSDSPASSAHDARSTRTNRRSR